MTEEEIQAEGEWSEFYQRAVARLAPLPAAKPFEVRVDVQETKAAAPRQKEEAPEEPQHFAPVLAPPKPSISSITPNMGTIDGGTAVTINGANFLPNSTVRLGGATCSSIVVVNSSIITCVTPAHAAGAVNVDVVPPGSDPNFIATLANGFTYLSPKPDSYDWVSSGPPLTPWGFNYGEIKALYIVARRNGQNYTAYQGRVNVSTIFIGPNTSFNDNPDIDYPIDVVDGVATLLIQAFCNASGSTTESLQFRATDALYTDVIGETPLMGVLSGSGSVGRKHGGGGGGGLDRFYFDGPDTNSGQHWYSWTPADPATHTVILKRLLVNGALNTGYNGQALLSYVQEGPQPPPSNGSGLGVSFPSTVMFTNGVATFGVSAIYNYSNAQGSQASGFFHLVATGGGVTTNSGPCAALNHL